jgi:hypothetical protein
LDSSLSKAHKASLRLLGPITTIRKSGVPPGLWILFQFLQVHAYIWICTYTHAHTHTHTYNIIHTMEYNSVLKREGNSLTWDNMNEFEEHCGK